MMSMLDSKREILNSNRNTGYKYSVDYTIPTIRRSFVGTKVDHRVIKNGSYALFSVRSLMQTEQSRQARAIC
jgi:hypothetical protein